jgi:hypothetical protein
MLSTIRDWQPKHKKNEQMLMIGHFSMRVSCLRKISVREIGCFPANEAVKASHFFLYAPLRHGSGRVRCHSAVVPGHSAPSPGGAAPLPRGSAPVPDGLAAVPCRSGGVRNGLAEVLNRLEPLPNGSAPPAGGAGRRRFLNVNPCPQADFARCAGRLSETSN